MLPRRGVAALSGKFGKRGDVVTLMVYWGVLTVNDAVVWDGMAEFTKGEWVNLRGPKRS